MDGNEGNTDDVDGQSSIEERPSTCLLQLDGRFLLTRSRGKTVGGNDSVGYRQGENRYLYLEEVLHLYDRGLLDVIKESTGDLLNLLQLYELPKVYGVPMPVLLAYQHLRRQTFYTIRHSSKRLAIIKAIDVRLQELGWTKRNNKTMTSDKKLALLRLELRQEAIDKKPPELHKLVFDCYNPGCLFSGACPRLPDFSVAVSYFNSKTWTFDDLQALMKEASTTVKIALVSDSGTVLMLGMTEFGAPLITK